MSHNTMLINFLLTVNLVALAQVEMVLIGAYCHEVFGWFAN